MKSILLPLSANTGMDFEKIGVFLYTRLALAVVLF